MIHVAVQGSKIRKLADGVVDPPSDLLFIFCPQSRQAKQILAMVCTQSKSSGASAELDYLADMTEFLRASTDMLIVVEGTELPCHKQVMAVHSKVFAGMADLTARLGHGATVSAQIYRCMSRLPLASWSSRKGPCMRACLTLL